ncbi:cobalamin-binding protein [Effusibacillus dendaii]|uniref:Cobalamin-binding protein n=1 Tax=Effusibacillus dendaii TaxID=2743772 RepID=A0A7I8DE23_9BACL|nr:cobalamin-binding protein [Effusibacillus dendaii]BCJ88448.1 cobalamin-binding protein [Effusibacillus dendaii]
MRIISICPSNTEILHALGILDQVVAIDDYSDWPVEQTKQLPHLGPDLSIDMDKLESFRPDLVIASLSVPGMEKNVEQLQERGIPHVVLNPKSIEEIYEDIRLLGHATGTEKQANELNISLQERVARVCEQVADRAYTPKLYWEWWPRPFISPAANSWLTEISRLAGGTNIFGDQPGDRVVDQTGEQIISSRPDFMLICWPGVDPKRIDVNKIVSRQGWQIIPAIRNNRIHVLEEGLYCRPSQRLFDGLEQLASLLHSV